MKSLAFLFIFLFVAVVVADDGRTIKYVQGKQSPDSFRFYPHSQPVNLTEVFAYNNGGAKNYKYKHVMAISVDGFDDFLQNIFLIDRYDYWLGFASETHAKYPGDIIAYYTQDYDGKSLCYILWFSDFIKDNQIFAEKYWRQK